MKGKSILLGVTGGISAYKSAELARLLVREEAEVQVVMTEAASHFVTPLTFETLTGRPVGESLFASRHKGVQHISLARNADLVIVAPLTAHTASRLALGTADDLLSTVYLAYRGPVLLAPAMNGAMLSHEAVQQNLSLLKQRGATLVYGAAGELACGEQGKGRMAEPVEILTFARRLLAAKDLAGMKVLVSAGPTREPIDPVRFLSNRSSGRMGYALAAVAAERGAEVTLVSGPCHITPPMGVKFISVETAVEMHRAITESFNLYDIIVMAAAVSDYKPRQKMSQKLKKTSGDLNISLDRNPDILAELGRDKVNGQTLVGFAAETERLSENARAKMKQKNLDLIVANDVNAPDSGFASPNNRVVIIDSQGQYPLPLLSKEEVAREIWDRVIQIRQSGK